MKYILIAILVMVFSPVLKSQDREYKTKKFNENFTWRTKSLSEVDSFYFDLPVVEHSKQNLFIRFSMDGQIIDLFSNDNVHFNGTLTNYIAEYKLRKTDFGKSHKIYKYHFQTKQLDSTKCRELTSFIINSGQDTIPTDTIINNWSIMILDCGSIFYQFMLESEYKEKEYYCPWSQDTTVQYKDIIIDNVETIKQQLDLKHQYKSFTSVLPTGVYSSNGMIMMTITRRKR